jgi:hypothetical protein
VTLIAKLCRAGQQAGSSKSVRPLLSSSMQLPQISSTPRSVVVVGNGVGEVAVVLLELAVVTVVVELDVLEVVGPSVLVVGARVVEVEAVGEVVLVELLDVVVLEASVVEVDPVGEVVLVELLDVVVVGGRVVDVDAGGDVVLVGLLDVVGLWEVVLVVLDVDVAVVGGAVVVVVSAAHPAPKMSTLQEACSRPCRTARFATWAAQLTYCPWFRAGQQAARASVSTSATP